MRIVFAGDWIPMAQECRFQSGISAVGNLECAFADGAVSSGKAYTSVVPFSFLNNIDKVGFSAISVANNHVYDAGQRGFDLLTAELGRRRVNYFGAREKPYAELADGSLKVAVIGCLEPCRSRGPGIFRQEDVLQLVKGIRSSFDKVYAYPHWGKEGEYTRWPSPAQQKLARKWIDAGVDGVFGSHSHVFQGKEEYKGKPIYYSLGNYLFPHSEGRLYDGTHDGMSVAIDGENIVENYHHFEDDGSFCENPAGLDIMAAISRPLCSWSAWKWAKAVGPFNLSKNAASWRIRLKKNFWMTLPKFLVWQLMPQTVFFRIAALLGRHRAGKCER